MALERRQYEVAPVELDVGRFVDWLCLHEHEVVGYPGTCFRSPLALWLSAQTGHVYGIDEGRYGRASQEFRFWRSLPRWARAFSSWVDACSATTYVLTGAEAFWVLVRVEVTLGPLVV